MPLHLSPLRRALLHEKEIIVTTQNIKVETRIELQDFVTRRMARMIDCAIARYMSGEITRATYNDLMRDIAQNSNR